MKHSSTQSNSNSPPNQNKRRRSTISTETPASPPDDYRSRRSKSSDETTTSPEENRIDRTASAESNGGGPSGSGVGQPGQRTGVVYHRASTTGESHIADKSCTKCRERKVRCDRAFPECKRCRKRRDTCNYPDIVNVESTIEEPEDQRLRLLEEKLAHLEFTLLHAPSPHSPTLPSYQISSPDPFPSILSAIQGSGDEISTKDEIQNFLQKELINRQRISASRDVDWMLARGGMAKELTVHLVYASMAACCSRLPAFSVLKRRIKPQLELGLPSLLDPSCQVAITVLCALGARSSPHSAILGIPVPVLPSRSTPPSPTHTSSSILITAGERREKAVRALEELAWDMCWKLGVLFGGRVRGGDEGGGVGEAEEDVKNLEVLVGLTQVMIFEDTRPMKARWLLKNALGLYEDLIQDEGRNSPSLQQVRKEIGPILFACDSVINAQLSRPSGITQTQLRDFFDPLGKGAQLLDLDNVFFSLEEMLKDVEGCGCAGLTETKIVDSLELSMGWVCACQRKFAMLSTVRRPFFDSPLKDVRKLWKTIDIAHSSVQRLQQILVNVARVPDGLDEFAMDDFVLLGVRTDTALVDLCNLMHEFLKTEFDHFGKGNSQVGDTREEQDLLVEMMAESELRVRKCLKLLAFYSHLYLASRDTHMVLHLSDQLNLLPDWVELAIQRVGDFRGPIATEYEVSLQELEWYAQALELACFYTPRAVPRLRELQDGRSRLAQSEKRHPAPQSDASPSSSDSAFSSPQQHDSAFSSPQQHFHSTSTSRATSNPESGFGSASLSPLMTVDANNSSRNPYGFNLLPGFLDGHPLNELGVTLPLNSGDCDDSGTPVSRRPELAQGFSGRSWMDLTLSQPWDLANEFGQGGEGDDGGGQREYHEDVYMAPGGSQW